MNACQESTLHVSNDYGDDMVHTNLAAILFYRIELRNACEFNVLIPIGKHIEIAERCDSMNYLCVKFLHSNSIIQ